MSEGEVVSAEKCCWVDTRPLTLRIPKTSSWRQSMRSICMRGERKGDSYHRYSPDKARFVALHQAIHKLSPALSKVGCTDMHFFPASKEAYWGGLQRRNAGRAYQSRSRHSDELSLTVSNRLALRDTAGVRASIPESLTRALCFCRPPISNVSSAGNHDLPAGDHDSQLPVSSDVAKSRSGSSQDSTV